MNTETALAMAMTPPTPECHVRVGPSTVAGNGLFATKDIPAGSTIVLAARPLICELDLPRLKDTCSNCTTWTFKSVSVCAIHNSQGRKEPGCEGCADEGKHAGVNACSGCKKVSYCSKQCQRDAWKRCHKYECKLLRDPALPPLPSSVRAALQLTGYMAGGSASEDDKAAVRRLQAHDYSTYDQLNEVESFEVNVQAARDLFERLSPGDLEASEIREYVGKILRNSLTLTTPTLDPLGIAFDPLVCTANHSCDPNASVLFDVPRLMMRSLAPIKKDEEIFISYIDNTNHFSRRQHELLNRYCFKCDCKKCHLGPTQREDKFLRPASRLERKWVDLCKDMDAIENFSSSPENYTGPTQADKNMSVLVGKAYQELEDARATSQTPAQSIATLESVMRLCNQTNMWPITKQPYATARNDIFAHLLISNKTGLALFQAIKIYFLIDPILYPQSFHPVRVVHTWGLVKTLVMAYSSGNDASSSPVDAGIQQLFDQEFDFVVPIVKVLKGLSQDVGKSHGHNSNLGFMVRSLKEQVWNGVGVRNLGVIESDPLGMWSIFKGWADALVY